MTSSEVFSSRSELLFLKFDVDDLRGPSLPTNGDVLRYYFYCRRGQPTHTPRAITRVVVDKCIKIWSDNGIPTTLRANGMKYLLQMLNKFNVMRSKYKGYSVTQRQRTQAFWQEKFQLIFSVATKDAIKKCSAQNREILLAAKEKKKEFRKAVKSNKFLVDFEKREVKTKPGPKSSKQLKVKDAVMKKSVNEEKRKQEGNRPGPKSSKKQGSDDVTVKDLSIASILSDSDTLNNNEAAELTKLEFESNTHRKDVVLPNYLDVGPEEEDIIPPMVQKTIIKEEIQMDWDEADNWSTSLLLRDDFSTEDKENNDPFDQLQTNKYHVQLLRHIM